MSRFAIYLVKEQMIVRMICAPFAHIQNFLSFNDDAGGVVRADDNVSFLTGFVGLLHPFEQRPLLDASIREDDARFCKIVFEEEVKRSVDSDFVPLLKKRKGPVVETACRTDPHKQVPFLGNIASI